MPTITIWILLATANGNVPIVVERFATKLDCEAAESRMASQSAGRRSMTYMHGICVQATVVKP